MDEAGFNALADAELERLEGLLDACVADFDYEVKPGGVLELEFDNGSKIIVNRHSAAQEMWVAARSGGFHYRWDGSRWLDTRDQSELMDALSVLISGQAGEVISLS